LRTHPCPSRPARDRRLRVIGQLRAIDQRRGCRQVDDVGLALVKLALVKLALVKLALVKLALVKLALVR
jgi:hypothetical protein